MKIFLDTADTKTIGKHFETGLIDGVTTNPTLIMKSHERPDDVYRDLVLMGLKDISMEVVGTKEEMLTEADRLISKFHDVVTIKVPCTPDGLAVCRDLYAQDVRVNVTLIFSVSQAILAVKAGARYLSPFVGRVYDQYWDGMDLIKQIDEIYDKHEVETEILAASIRNPIEVPTAFRMGADVVTMPIDIFSKLYDHVLTKQGLDKFNEDWSQLMMEIHSDE